MVMPINRRCPVCGENYMGGDCIKFGEVCPACDGGLQLGMYDIIMGATNVGKSMMSIVTEFATEKHKGQRRKNGEDYIEHPKRVGNRILQMYGMDISLFCIALLHDTLEDTATTKEELITKFGKEIANVVEMLSRKKDETYFDFIMRLHDRKAIRIKLADLDDNLSDLDEGSMKDKYRFAHYILEQRLEKDEAWQDD